MKVCAANSKRKGIQHFDHQFKQRSSSRRFKILSAKKRLCPSLRVNQEVVTDPKTIVEAGKDHFRVLSSVNLEQPLVMYSSEDEVETLMLNSLDNEDYLLDVPFVSEEVDGVLKKLKLGKAAGHNGLRTEHLKYGGPML